MSILCDVEIPDPAPKSEPIVGIDRGIVNILADSDGRLARFPLEVDKSVARLRRLKRQFSNKEMGSKNSERAKIRVARAHRKLRRQRHHFTHVESCRYAKKYGTVVIERLNTAAMMRGNCGSAIRNSGWRRFETALQYKLRESGGSVVSVSPQYSSQTCSSCGVIDPKSRRLEAFSCRSCGHNDHADVNAAKVLKARAVESTVTGCGGYVQKERPKRQQFRVARRGNKVTTKSLSLSQDVLSAAVLAASQCPDYGSRVRIIRQAYNWTAVDLALASGVMKQAISSIEHNRVPFGRRRAAALAQALHVEPSVFLDGVEKHAALKKRVASNAKELSSIPYEPSD